MKFMNDWDIAYAQERLASHPVLSRATTFLRAFQIEVDRVSDGWTYWSAPVMAARKLIFLIESGDATEAQFKAALTPIKSFYTRKGYAAGMAMPKID